MKTILKRTTAIAALAALPIAPFAAHAQSELVPDDDDIKIYKSKEDSAPSQAEVTKEDGEYIQRTTDDAGQSTAEQTAPTAMEGKDDTAAADQQADEPGAQEQAADTLQGQDVEPGAQPGQPPAQQQPAQAQGVGQEDVLIATVGDAEIRSSDVVAAIGMLPPQLQQQPPEMLIPIALDQLVLRELILQEARQAGLQDEQQVRDLAVDESEAALEDAMVQAWLDRELADAVTDEKVSETYGTIQGQLGDQAPSLDEVRPQIEEELRRQAFNTISTELQADADITVFGPDGQPVAQ